MNKRLMRQVIIGFFSAQILTAASPASAGDKAPTVGLAVAQSGFMTAYDGDATKSVLLWIDDQNAKGGLLGKTIKSVIVDTKSDRAQGARAGQDVIDQGADLVVVSCDYDYGSSAAAAAQRAKLVSMFLCAEDPKAGVQGAGPYAFTSSAAAQVQGATMAEWGQKKLRIKKVYYLLDTTVEYNKAVLAGFDWSAKRLGLTVLGSDTFKNDDPSLQSQITRINALAEKPDAIILCSIIPGGASAIKQIRAAGLDMPILSDSALDGNYWTAAVPNLNNVYLPVQASVYGDDPRPEVNDYAKRFQAKYGQRPTTTYAVPAYAFMDLWGRAVEKAGTTDASKVVPIMEQYKNEVTMIGPKTFSAQYHIQLDAVMQILRYENGKPKVIDQYRIEKPLTADVLFRTK
jgi:branched-chain amino acid transport system substrate-binding protein